MAQEARADHAGATTIARPRAASPPCCRSSGAVDPVAGDRDREPALSPAPPDQQRGDRERAQPNVSAVIVREPGIRPQPCLLGAELGWRPDRARPAGALGYPSARRLFGRYTPGHRDADRRAPACCSTCSSAAAPPAPSSVEQWATARGGTDLGLRVGGERGFRHGAGDGGVADHMDARHQPRLEAHRDRSGTTRSDPPPPPSPRSCRRAAAG